MSFPTKNTPHDRQSFRDYCLRRLGAPVNHIEVDDEQVEDRIDDALQYYWDYHVDGAERVYFKHQITPEDIARRYIEVPDKIIGVAHILALNTSMITLQAGIFSLRYQLALNQIANLSAINTAPFVQAMQQMELIDNVFSRRVNFRFNRHTNKVYLDINLDANIDAGEYIILEAYVVLDPDVYSNAWRDRWLQRYATALIKRQWGENLKKFEGVQMLGGVTFNGQKIYDEAIEEITKLEDEMLTTHSQPPGIFIG